VKLIPNNGSISKVYGKLAKVDFKFGEESEGFLTPHL